MNNCTNIALVLNLLIDKKCLLRVSCAPALVCHKFSRHSKQEMTVIFIGQCVVEELYTTQNRIKMETNEQC